ncbi:hypothetical protein [Vibrio tarriae]|uniref:hypothetical protein n=1 Tax=Vibrio tarriae TaxID=2014742 RepID=UPI000DE1C025|nr:hypothetical protein [Vibrio tarriae]QEO44557.1 hypothetical protein F0315_04195 [Vibrio cholerae]RBM35400.1 hypothetical protein DLR58_05505 [Vibrio tarriae]
MSVSLSVGTEKLKKAFSFSALESIGSRVFDIVTLWLILNSLQGEDLVNFGLATSTIFIFNFFLISPETSLLRKQKEWESEGRLESYITTFASFSILKIAFHYIAIIILFLNYGELNWIIYAVVFSAATQQIQSAEIVRIFMRMNLRQKEVLRLEIFTKSALCLSCLYLFIQPNVSVYFLIYLLWSLLAVLVWWLVALKSVSFTRQSVNIFINNLKDSVVGFSLWSHLVGVISYFVYNSNLLFMKYYSFPTDTLALFTSITKVSNLFFVIPMFFQSFVPVLLSNSGDEKSFNRLQLACSGFALVQFLIFLIFGKYLGLVFGVSQEYIDTFFKLGIWVNAGILLLNLTRPMATYIIIRKRPSALLWYVSLPTAVSTLFLYPLYIEYFDIYGAVYASFSVFLIMSMLILLRYSRK